MKYWKTNLSACICIFSVLYFESCIQSESSKEENNASTVLQQPKEIIDLGALVTEDLPEQVWGRVAMKQYNFTKSNHFEVVKWELDTDKGKVKGSNSYFTIFNHGGPHVDAPNHAGLGKGLDDYSVNAFVGPLKVVDASKFPLGRGVTVEEIQKHNIQQGDIVIIYTRHILPKGDELSHNIALTREAAKYLVSLPVRAFGTDAWNVEGTEDQPPVETEIATELLAPIHYTFLSEGIPIFEQLFNVDKLLDKENMLFVGPPLNIKDGDGMIVRPLVLVY